MAVRSKIIALIGMGSIITDHCVNELIHYCGRGSSAENIRVHSGSITLEPCQMHWPLFRTHGG